MIGGEARVLASPLRRQVFFPLHERHVPALFCS